MHSSEFDVEYDVLAALEVFERPEEHLLDFNLLLEPYSG